MEIKDMRLYSEDAVLVAIDYQDRLMPVMAERDFLTDRVVRMIRGAKEFNIPIIVTQQYTKGLGNTVPRIKEALGEFEPIEKTVFSAVDCPEFMKTLEATGRKTVLLMGIETHICVMQTALALIESGYRVFLVEDCCSARSLRDSKMGRKRISEAGAIVTTMESALMEMLGGAESEHFKTVSKIIK